jgi:ubiquinone/menaquinone biosynthesis C-methylase UbiE
MKDQRRALWDHEAEAFDEAADHGLRDPATRTAWQRPLLPLLPNHPQAVADLGCGTGTLTILFAQAGHHVHGVDFSPQMLDIARNKATNVAPALRFTEGDVAAPALPAGSFDVVLSRHVLWAMPDPQAALQSWSRLLRVGGQLLLIEGNWSTGAGLTATQTLSLLRQLGGDTELHNLDDPALWGRQITDERYLTITRPASSAAR